MGTRQLTATNWLQTNCPQLAEKGSHRNILLSSQLSCPNLHLVMKSLWQNQFVTRSLVIVGSWSVCCGQLTWLGICLYSLLFTVCFVDNFWLIMLFQKCYSGTIFWFKINACPRKAEVFLGKLFSGFTVMGKLVKIKRMKWTTSKKIIWRCNLYYIPHLLRWSKKISVKWNKVCLFKWNLTIL